MELLFSVFCWSLGLMFGLAVTAVVIAMIASNFTCGHKHTFSETHWDGEYKTVKYCVDCGKKISGGK